MKQKIQDLLQEHLLGRMECREMLNELHSIEVEKISAEEKEDLKITKLSLEIELSWRNSVISDLEDILDETV